jgi:hypothetical protein
MPVTADSKFGTSGLYDVGVLMLLNYCLSGKPSKLMLSVCLFVLEDVLLIHP